MMRVYEIANVLITLNDGNDDEKGGDLCQKGRNLQTPPFLLITKNFCTE